MRVLTTTRQRVLYEAREIWRNDFITFDTETSGLEHEDQIIQWAVCDREGQVLFSSYIKPTVPISKGAFEIHGISEEQLTNAPSFEEAWWMISSLLTWGTTVIYNSNFDIRRLWASAKPYNIQIPHQQIKTICAMELFARFYSEYNEYWGGYTWQKLNEVAIPHLGIQIPGQAHDAAHDAAATAMIIKKLAELADKELPPGWHPPVMVQCTGGCKMVQECAEADEIWYCSNCGIKEGLYHQCPGCDRLIKIPATSIPCEDLCKFCKEKLHQEAMILTGAWHRCPKHKYYATIVETSDLEELCNECKQQIEYRRLIKEEERRRREKTEQKRKEHRREYAKEYRKRRKERVAQGLSPTLPKTEIPEIFTHNGHRFKRQKDENGRRSVFCLICGGTWSRPPQVNCNGVKTYWSWTGVPEHLKTKTQLKKLHLKPAENQKHEAVMETSFDRYWLYDQNKCVPMRKKSNSD